MKFSSPQRLLADLRSRGVAVTVELGKLVLRAAAGSVSPELQTRVAVHRDSIINILTSQQSGSRSASTHRPAHWPPELAEWVKSLSVADLSPSPFKLNSWSTVVDGGRFLGWMQSAATRRTLRIGDDRAIVDAKQLLGLIAPELFPLNPMKGQ